jgi:Flp pilus assembly pilin Flp
MNYIDYGLIIFLIVVVIVGVGGFILANRD